MCEHRRYAPERSCWRLAGGAQEEVGWCGGPKDKKKKLFMFLVSIVWSLFREYTCFFFVCLSFSCSLIECYKTATRHLYERKREGGEREGGEGREGRRVREGGSGGRFLA